MLQYIVVGLVFGSIYALAASGKLARKNARTPGGTVLVYEKKTFHADMSAKDAALPC